MVGLNGTPIDDSWLHHTTVQHDRTRNEVQKWHSPAASWPDVEVEDLEVERSRLEAEIAAGKARVAAAKHRAAEMSAALAAALRAEVAASQGALAEMELQHEAEIARIREAADADVERILAAARRHVADTVTPAPRTERAQVNHAE
jgi:hypothetical protein